MDLTKTQISILEVLSNKWYEFLKVPEICNISKLSMSSAYESITKLKNRKFIIESNGTYKINFSSDVAWALKRLNDASKLSHLPERINNKIIEIREKANLFFSENIIAVLVFGSSASLDIGEESDVDFFIILRHKKEGFLDFLTSSDKNFNFIQNDVKEFSEGYDIGDDFIISVLKNHILLQGEDYIRPFLQKDLPIITKKVIHDREIQLNKLEKKIDKLLFQDHPIAYDKIKEFIRLKIRLLLIKSNIVPISNKNLFKIMKKQFPQYYNAYNKLNRKNAREIYIGLMR